MAQIETWLNQDLLKPVKVQYIDGNVFSMDNAGNLIGVNITRDGAAYSGGGSVSANVIRSDGATVAVSGALSGNAATVVLPQAAYAVPGVISVVIKLTVSGEITTIGAVVANVYQSTTDAVIDPGTIIPDISELIAEIEEVVASIPADYTSLWAAIAPVFSSSNNYSVGEYVTYNENLYRFVANHNAGSWSSSDVITMTLGTGIGDAERAIKAIGTGTYDLGVIIPNSYIQSSNGAIATWSGNSATEFIPCFMANKIITQITNTIPYNENAFYTRNKTFISSFGVPAGIGEITVPSNAYYVRFSNKTENMETLVVSYKLKFIDVLAKIGASTVFPATSVVPSFTKNDTTISFYCASLIGAKYTGEGCVFSSTYILMNSAVSVPHDSWCIWNIGTNAIEVISDTNLKKTNTTEYCALFYNSSGNVRGLFEKYAINNRITSEEPYIWKGNCIVAPYGQASLSFEITGTTINITCNRYVVYNDMTLSWRMCERLSEPTISVPHDKFLVYVNSSNTLEVMSDSQISALTDKQYYVLFYNSNGKICGPFEMYFNRYQCETIKVALASIGASYPSYYDSHVKTKMGYVNANLADLATGDAFVFITDIHYPDNMMYSPSLVKDACAKSGISKVILNGDYINRESLKADAMIQNNRICSMYEYPGVDTYRVVGNHEFNNPGNSQDPEYLANELSASELRWTIINPNRDKIVYAPDSLSYYFDNEKEKIRYFVGAVTKTSGMVAESIRWIAGQVENVPSGWGVVIFQHTVLSYAGNVVHVVNEHFENILNAMKAKTSYNYLGTTFDYTGKTFEFIACFCGDYHLDMDYTTTDGALIIATTCDTRQQEGSLPRTVGTYAEQAFDVVVINRASNVKKIYLTRIGAGDDREFSY